MALKVAIIGLAADSHDLAPWSDPSWELWGLAWDGSWPKFHRTFEPHDMANMESWRKEKLGQYLERLNDCTNLYVQEPIQEVPSAKRYPHEEIEALTQTPPACTISYALAMAIYEGAQEIGIWGVNMEQSGEYDYQRPNMHYLIGFARGRGIKVTVHESSPLMRFMSDPDYDYDGRYGRTRK